MIMIVNKLISLVLVHAFLTDGNYLSKATSSSSVTASVTATTKSYINLVVSSNTLLSGGLNDCHNGTIDDTSCTAGIAATNAYIRYYDKPNDDHGGTVVLNKGDWFSELVYTHPLGWNVNRLVLHEYYKYKVFIAVPWLTIRHYKDSELSTRDLSPLQTKQYTPLIGNYMVYSTVTWSEYVKNIHFDIDTNTAIIYIDNYSITNHDYANLVFLNPVQYAIGLLNYIANENLQISEHCFIHDNDKKDSNIFKENDNDSANMMLSSINSQGNMINIFDSYVKFKNFTNNSDNNSNNNNEKKKKCWMPIILYDDVEKFDEFVNELLLSVEYPPALIANIKTNLEPYTTPQISAINNSTWIVSYKTMNEIFNLVTLTLSSDTITESTAPSTKVVLSTITYISILSHDIATIPSKIKDNKFYEDIQFLRTLANEANENNPIVGYSTFMNYTKGPNGVRPCFETECPLGNLFADALQWYTKTDIAFMESGRVRGDGWEEGPVRISNIWNSLPFANTECTGVMSGITLYRMLETVTSNAVYQLYDHPLGDHLLQVSGLRYTYNTKIETPPRLLSIEIYNKTSNLYVPIDRLKLYTFATSSWMCSGFEPYATMLKAPIGDIIDGEIGGKIGSVLLQDIVGDYLSFSSLDGNYYNTSIDGRLIDNTSSIKILKLVQTEKDCNSTTYWVSSLLSCINCPTTDNVEISVNDVEFTAIESVADNNYNSGSSDGSTGFITNGETFPISIVLRSSPKWISFPSTNVYDSNNQEAKKVLLLPREKFEFEFVVISTNLDVGAATGSISFVAISDGVNYQGCIGRDITVRVAIEVIKQKEVSKAGFIKIVGFLSMGFISIVAISLGILLMLNRSHSVLKAMQPEFLTTICFGITIIAATIIPLSIVNGFDDLSDELLSNACQGTPCLLSFGFTIVFAAIFSKLRRLNTIIESAARFERRNVTIKDAFVPFSIMFAINFVLLSAWTLVDPMEYEINTVKGESWNLYGSCGSNMGVMGKIFAWLIFFVNVLALWSAMYECYKARLISDSFSESKSFGLAIFTWLEILVIGAPVLFLIAPDNVNAKYFLQVAMIFLMCLSMLLFIFVPIIQRVAAGHDSSDIAAELNSSNTAMRKAAAELNSTNISTRKTVL